MMPAYNGARYVGEAIDSVLKQTFHDFELVVVDDCSTDNTADVVAERCRTDARVRLVCHTENRGEGASRNTALASFTEDSEYVAFLDCDDLWQPTSLEDRLEAARRTDDSVGAYGRYRHVDETGVPLTGTELPLKRWTLRHGLPRRLAGNEPNNFASLAFRFCYVPGAFLVRHRAISRAGRFDPSLRISCDDDMFLRVARQGVVHFVESLVLDYRIHGNNVTADGLLLEQSVRLVYERYLDDDRLEQSERRDLGFGYGWEMGRALRSHGRAMLGAARRQDAVGVRREASAVVRSATRAGYWCARSAWS
jgi:glycosyltransferase involved in cell wall biosynthesis